MGTDVPATNVGGVPVVGDLLGGKYRVEGVIGEGGMGMVLAARHLELGHRVAIKFMHPELAKAPGAPERFLREAHAAVAMKGDHVARVIDVDKLETGAPYLIMEFLEGTDVARLLDRGPLPVDVAVNYLLQACEAVAEAHSQGIVHRDIKPANLFVTTRPDGTSLVKVLDFGIAKALAAVPGAVKLTTTGVAIGTPGYMSPEQVRDAANVDARSDIWSLGVTLYECLTGELPFDASSAAAMCAAIAADPPRAMAPFRKDVPAELEAAVMRCLEKDPSRRHLDVGAFALALEVFSSADGAASAARAVRLSGRREPSVPQSADSWSGRDSLARTMDASSGSKASSAATIGATSATTSQSAREPPPRWRRPAVAVGGVAVGAVLVWSLLPPTTPAHDAVSPAAAAPIKSMSALPAPTTGAAPPEVQNTAPSATPPAGSAQEHTPKTKSATPKVRAESTPQPTSAPALPPRPSPPPARTGSNDALLTDRK